MSEHMYVPGFDSKVERFMASKNWDDMDGANEVENEHEWRCRD